jgi:hypothetical protein
VQHGVGALEGRIGQVVAIEQVAGQDQMCGRRRRLAPVDPHDGDAAGHQLSDDGPADEAGRAGDDHRHVPGLLAAGLRCLPEVR